MLVTLTEVYEENRIFNFREVLVNLDHVNFAREDPYILLKVFESKSISGLDERVKFTRLFINRGNMGQELVVVGSLEEINKKFLKTSKTLLKD